MTHLNTKSEQLDSFDQWQLILTHESESESSLFLRQINSDSPLMGFSFQVYNESPYDTFFHWYGILSFHKFRQVIIRTTNETKLSNISSYLDQPISEKHPGSMILAALANGSDKIGITLIGDDATRIENEFTGLGFHQAWERFKEIQKNFQQQHSCNESALI